MVETQAEGEYFDVVIGSTNFASSNMHAKQRQFRDKYREQYQRLLSGLRARPEENAVFLLNPVKAGDKRALLFMRDGQFVPISVSAIIAVVNVLTWFPSAGRLRPIRLAPQYFFETLAGNICVDVSFESEADETPRCDSVTVRNVPSFALKLNYPFNVRGLGDIRADIAYGGVMCAFVDASSVGVSITNEQRPKLLEVGERIKSTLRAQYTPVHPLDPAICGASTVVFTQNVRQQGWRHETLSVAVVVPGRLAQSPSGVVTSARLAVLHARGLIGDEVLVDRSLTGAGYCGRIIGETTVGEYRAILPIIRGRAWVTGVKHVAESNPFRGGISNDTNHWVHASQAGTNVDSMENLWLPPRPRQETQQESRDPQQVIQQDQQQPQEHQQEPPPEPQKESQCRAEYNECMFPLHQQMRWSVPWRNGGKCKCWTCIAYEIWNLPLTYGILVVVAAAWLLDICIQHHADLFCLVLRALVSALDWTVVLFSSLGFRITI